MTAITLLDGGMGQELVHRAGDQPTPLWSTQVMIDHPGLVEAVHAEYFAAGATVATTNTYAIHRDRLQATPLAANFEDLHRRALAAAKEARAAHGSGRIAGSVGPLRASYRPDLHPASAVARPLFAEVASILAPSCDLLIVETAVSLTHAADALAGAAVAGVPVWLAVSVDDHDGTRLRSGEALADVLPLAAQGASAILVNCSSPEAIKAALPILAKGDLPFGAYANGFQQITADFLKDKPTVDALSARRDLGPEAYAEHVMSWVAGGATIVGGCCEVGPAHISEIARRLTASGHTIV
jgi:homocysteine S-methyltransferase